MPAHHLPFRHDPGRHCGSTALHNAMVYHGIEFSEARCFGLGCGLGFYYAKVDGMEIPRIIGGRSRTLETDFFEVIGRPWTWKLEDDADTAWRNVAEYIDHDVPVMLRTDIFYLDYYHSSTHFAGHTILLVGYDTDAGMAYTSDTHFPEIQEVSLERLAEARASSQPPMPLEYHWHQIEKPASLPPMRETMLFALRRTSQRMLEGESMAPIAYQGIPGLELFAREVPAWPDVFGESWSWPTRFAYQIIERRGTGGGNFRYLYADFLREVEAEVPELAGLKLSTHMQTIGEQWTALSDTFKELSEAKEPGDLFLRAGDQAAHIAAAELDFHERVLHRVPEA